MRKAVDRALKVGFGKTNEKGFERGLSPASGESYLSSVFSTLVHVWVPSTKGKGIKPDY